MSIPQRTGSSTGGHQHRSSSRRPRCGSYIMQIMHAIISRWACLPNCLTACLLIESSTISQIPIKPNDSTSSTHMAKVAENTQKKKTVKTKKIILCTMRRQHFVRTSIKTVSSREKSQKTKKSWKKQLRKRKWNVYSAIIKSFMFQFGAAFGQCWRRLI